MTVNRVWSRQLLRLVLHALTCADSKTQREWTLQTWWLPRAYLPYPEAPITYATYSPPTTDSNRGPFAVQCRSAVVRSRASEQTATRINITLRSARKTRPEEEPPGMSSSAGLNAWVGVWESADVPWRRRPGTMDTLRQLIGLINYNHAS